MSVFFFLFAVIAVQVHANELAIGSRSKTLGAIVVPIVQPIELDWNTRDQVLGLRTKEVEKYRSLLTDSYEPGECFDRMEDKRPWWGLYGLHVYRRGKRSIEGPSKESSYLLNPFRLVAAEPNNIGIWKENSLTNRELSKPGFPFFWSSSAVTFDPRRSHASVTYDVTGYHRQLAKWIPHLKGDVVIQNFSLIAYNAGDFGLPFMYLDPKNSLNLVLWKSPDALEIPQMIHCGGSCGYPGGCNNMSPHRVELDNNRLTRLPARAYLRLWRERPKDAKTSPPDFVMIIDFI